MKSQQKTFQSPATMLKSFLLCSVVLLFSAGYANASLDEQKVQQLSHEKFNDWVNVFYKESLSKGISKETLDTVLGQVKLNPKVISFDRRQPFKTRSFESYRNSIVPQSRINKANKKYQENKELLDEIGRKYGVQPRFIVALWGIESNFGINMGKYSIPDSLATLSFEGRRAKFFRKELFSAIKIIDEGHIDYNQMIGSWAGAMGQTQFMPSSFLSLAVDYNNDGKKDIWSTKEDVFASIANYLSKTKWDDSATWGRQIILPKGFNKNMVDIKNKKSLQEWSALGVRKIDGSPLPTRDIRAALVQPDDNGNEFYLVYGNYDKILKWNRSLYFATAVGLLSDRIVTGG